MDFMTTFYTSVMPALSRMFSVISTLAMMPYSSVIDFLFPPDGLNNYLILTGMMGETIHFTSPTYLFQALGVILNPVLRAVGGNVANLPFVFALLILFAETFILISFAKFVFSLVSKLPLE